jgi:two-component system sensor histidine kinase RegB
VSNRTLALLPKKMFSLLARNPSAPATAHLEWLFWLRNVAIAGQTLAVAITVYGLHLPLPIMPIATIIGGLALLNALTWWRLGLSVAVSHGEFFAQLALDVAALTGLLYLTGGATNPFTWLFLLPLTIAAALSPKGYIWAMVGLTTACYTLLMVVYVPFPYGNLHREGGFGLHVFGMWLGFVISAGIVAYFVVGMAESLRQREQSLAAAREQAMRDERVIALGTLAAGTAHELGTPLGTMAVLAKELEQEYVGERFADLHAGLHILRTQVDRCKQALAVIAASAGEVRAEAAHPLSAETYLRDLVEQWRGLRPGVQVHYRLHGSVSAPVILCERTLSQALLSILNNAADASPQAVELDGQWDRMQLVIEVNDRGVGLSTTTLASVLKTPVSTKPDGLGLGLFLAHAAIGRLGGQVSLADRDGGGTNTRVVLPLARLLAGAAP